MHNGFKYSFIKLHRMYRKLLGITSVDMDLVEQLLIRYSAFVVFCSRKWVYNGRVHQLGYVRCI